MPGDATSENVSPDVRTEWAVESEDEQPLPGVVLYLEALAGHDMQVEASQAPRWAWPCARRTPATPVH